MNATFTNAFYALGRGLRTAAMGTTALTGIFLVGGVFTGIEQDHHRKRTLARFEKDLGRKLTSKELYLMDQQLDKENEAYHRMISQKSMHF